MSDRDHRPPRIPPPPPAHSPKIGVMVLACVIVLVFLAVLWSMPVLWCSSCHSVKPVGDDEGGGRHRRAV